MTRARLRDLGITIGRFPTGQHNAITDVPGVWVGHTTLIRDEPRVFLDGSVEPSLPQELLRLLESGLAIYGHRVFRLGQKTKVKGQTYF